MSATASAIPRQYRRMFAVMVAAVASVFVLSQVYRYMITLIVPEIARELSLSASEVGALGATLFFSFAAMQIPAGIIIDRWGPRRAVSFMQVFAVAGMLVASASQSLGTLTLAMVLMGAGSSCNLVSALVIGARWLPGDRFAAMTGTMIALGATGHVLSTVPMAVLVEAVGWRQGYAIVAVLAAVAGIAAYVTVRNAPPDAPQAPRERETLLASLRGTAQVFRTRGMARLVIMTAMGPATFFTMRGLWAGPYFADVQGLAPQARGSALLVVALAMIAGNLSYGFLDRRLNSRRRLVMIGTWLLIGAFALLAAFPEAPLGWALVFFGLLGLFAPYDVILFAHARSMFPHRLAGRAMTTVNLALFVGFSSLQFASGHLMQWAQAHDFTPAQSFRCVFLFLIAVSVVGFACYRGIADARPSDDGSG
ncbi:MAG: MFS transporter [Alphaproteobacteria bacterium]